MAYALALEDPNRVSISWSWRSQNLQVAGLRLLQPCRCAFSHHKSYLEANNGTFQASVKTKILFGISQHPFAKSMLVSSAFLLRLFITYLGQS